MIEYIPRIHINGMIKEQRSHETEKKAVFALGMAVGILGLDKIDSVNFDVIRRDSSTGQDIVKFAV